LFVVLLIKASLSQELKPPANPAQFKVKELRREMRDMKEPVADLTPENRTLSLMQVLCTENQRLSRDKRRQHADEDPDAQGGYHHLSPPGLY
jgi:hypothetical protein